MIFDEVDTGIGGRTAALVGKKLQAVSAGRQVLCVTHLASVAAYADAHFHIAKNVGKHSTDVVLTEISGQQQIQEIARMLGALSDHDETALLHAKKILDAAH